MPVLTSLTTNQIADILCEACGILIPRQRITSILGIEHKKGMVAADRRGGQTYFKVMKRGEDELIGSGLKPLFVDPARALSSIRAVEGILRSLEGEVKICDPYVESRTLDYIALMDKAQQLSLLTENVQDSARLKRDFVAFGREHKILLEIRIAPSGQLHDRYILHSTGMLFIGASLKDLAKKQSMIVSLPISVASELRRAFDRNWNGASKFP